MQLDLGIDPNVRTIEGILNEVHDRVNQFFRDQHDPSWDGDPVQLPIDSTPLYILFESDRIVFCIPSEKPGHVKHWIDFLAQFSDIPKRITDRYLSYSELAIEENDLSFWLTDFIRDTQDRYVLTRYPKTNDRAECLSDAHPISRF